MSSTADTYNGTDSTHSEQGMMFLLCRQHFATISIEIWRLRPLGVLGGRRDRSMIVAQDTGHTESAAPRRGVRAAGRR